MLPLPPSLLLVLEGSAIRVNALGGTRLDCMCSFVNPVVTPVLCLHAGTTLHSGLHSDAKSEVASAGLTMLTSSACMPFAAGAFDDK